MISVIVPVYNVEKYLRKCVASIVSQTYSDLEIILVDDGSKDSSPQICDELERTDNRIKVIHKENGGLSDARNAGIDIAAGEYLAFIDSDDYIHPQMMEILYKNLKDADADLSVCDFHWIEENEQVEDCVDNSTALFSGEDILDQIKLQNVITVVAWNKLYKRKLFDNLRYEKGRYHEDEFMIHHILLRCKKTVYTTCKLYYYIRRSGSITGTVNAKRIIDTLESLEDRITAYKDSNLKKYYIDVYKTYISLIPRYYNQLEESKIDDYKAVQRKLRKKLKDSMSVIEKEKLASPKTIIRHRLWLISPSMTERIHSLYKKVRKHG